MKHIYNQSRVSSVGTGRRKPAGGKPGAGGHWRAARHQLSGKGLYPGKDGGIRVDEYLHAGQDIYAAGDITHYPEKGKHVRIEALEGSLPAGTRRRHEHGGRPLEVPRRALLLVSPSRIRISYAGMSKDYTMKPSWKGDLDGDLLSGCTTSKTEYPRHPFAFPRWNCAPSRN